jgi:hypothetical protein
MFGSVRNTPPQYSDVRDGEHRNGISGLEPSEFQHSAIGANRDYRSQSRFVYAGEHQMCSDVRDGEHRNVRSGLAPSGVQHAAIGVNHDYRSQSRFVYAGKHQRYTGLVSSVGEDSANTRSGHQSQYGIPHGEEHMDLSVTDVPQMKKIGGANDVQSLVMRDEYTMVSSGGHERYAPGGPASSGVQHSASSAGSVRHDVRQFRNSHDRLARSGVQDSASASPNHAALVATSGPYGNTMSVA